MKTMRILFLLLLVMVVACQNEEAQVNEVEDVVEDAPAEEPESIFSITGETWVDYSFEKQRKIASEFMDVNEMWSEIEGPEVLISYISSYFSENDSINRQVSTVVDEFIEEMRRVVHFPELIVTDRKHVIFENEHGTVTYLGEHISSLGFYLAFEVQGDLSYSDPAIPFLRAIFEDGSSEHFSSNDVVQRRFIDNETDIFLISKNFDYTAPIIRLDYNYAENNKILEDEGKETITHENEPQSQIHVPAAYGIPTSYYEVDFIHEDNEKQVHVKEIHLSDKKMTVSVDITYNEDTNAKPQTFIQRVRNLEHIKHSRAINHTDFWSGIPVSFELEYDFAHTIADDDGAIIVLGIDGALFHIDLRTGELLDGDLKVNRWFEFHAGNSQKPHSGKITNDGEVHYQFVDDSRGYFNKGTGTKVQWSQELYVGSYNQLSFTLKSGDSLKNEGGDYMIYLLDKEDYLDNENFRDDALWSINFKGTSDPVSATVDVSQTDEIIIFADTTKTAKSCALNCGGIKREHLIHLMFTDTVLSK